MVLRADKASSYDVEAWRLNQEKQMGQTHEQNKTIVRNCDESTTEVDRQNTT